ncbi:MAG: hypothetical protein H7X93_07435, partial [Sphingomonadaceae bacterium]|nr:hypothetical protein [Sphingomonadaceae bacterium]
MATEAVEGSADLAKAPEPWRLPHLRGLAMRVYVAVWFALLAAAIAMPVAGLYLVHSAPVEAPGLQYEGTGFTRWSADLIGDVGALLVPLALVPAALLLFRQRAEPVPALLSIALLIISATSFFGAFATDALGLVATAPALLWLGWAGIILALLCFPDGRLAPRWAAIVAGLLLAQLIAVELGLFPGNVHLLGWVALLALAVAALAARYRRLPPGVERQQLRWVFFGFAVGAILFGAGMVILAGEPMLVALDRRWSVWIEVTVTPFAALGLVSFALGLMVSLLRYRLYDAETVIGRSAAYGVLTLGFVALFASIGKTIELIGERWFAGSIGWGAGVIGVGLAALIVAPLHDRVRRWAERRFKADLAALREELPRAMRYVRET